MSSKWNNIFHRFQEYWKNECSSFNEEVEQEETRILSTSVARRKENPKIEKVDVLIVGGGIVGVSTALFLARKDSSTKIRVVERGYIGSEASGLSAGTIWNASYGDRSHAGLLLGQMTVDLCEELNKIEDVDFEFEKSGAFSIANNSEELERQRKAVCHFTHLFLSLSSHLSVSHNLPLLRYMILFHMDTMGKCLWAATLF